jgi:transposase InsO family protein
MDIHRNARTTPESRAIIVKRVLKEGQSLNRVARDFGVDVHTVRKWVKRFQSEGAAGLQDRSSRPKHSPTATSDETLEQIALLRRRRWTVAQIAQKVGVSPATVSRILRRLGLNRLKALEPAEPVRRYVHSEPGSLIHLDIKRLARFRHPGHRVTGNLRRKSVGAGWEFVHVAIDDASRISYVELHGDQRQESAVAFLHACLRYYAKLGVKPRRILTDNGSCYRSKAFRRTCRQLGLRHIFTRPYRPQTNGKAERFIQTALREWAYAQAYPDSTARRAALWPWLHRYNWHRPHGSLNKHSPMSTLGLTMDNLVRHHN